MKFHDDNPNNTQYVRIRGNLAFSVANAKRNKYMAKVRAHRPPFFLYFRALLMPTFHPMVGNKMAADCDLLFNNL